MTVFEDANKNKWTLNLNVGTAQRCKAETGVDLMNVIVVTSEGIQASAIDKIAEDPSILVSVIYSLCQEQIKEKGLTEFQFAEIFTSDVIDSASDALIKEIINFSQPVKRKMLTLLYNKTREFKAKAESQLDEILTSEETSKDIDEQLNKLLTNSPELSESIQAPSH